MHVRFHELIGKRVVDSRGEPLGRIAELTAGRRGNALCVTAFRVGPTALLRRVGLSTRGWLRTEPIPWALVAAIDERSLHLHVPTEELTTGLERVVVDEQDPHEPVGGGES